jgi:hypothetical protein
VGRVPELSSQGLSSWFVELAFQIGLPNLFSLPSGWMGDLIPDYDCGI